jgi:hypothetical protein
VPPVSQQLPAQFSALNQSFMQQQQHQLQAASQQLQATQQGTGTFSQLTPLQQQQLMQKMAPPVVAQVQQPTVPAPTLQRQQQQQRASPMAPPHLTQQQQQPIQLQRPLSASPAAMPQPSASMPPPVLTGQPQQQQLDPAQLQMLVMMYPQLLQSNPLLLQQMQQTLFRMPTNAPTASSQWNAMEMLRQQQQQQSAASANLNLAAASADPMANFSHIVQQQLKNAEMQARQQSVQPSKATTQPQPQVATTSSSASITKTLPPSTSLPSVVVPPTTQPLGLKQAAAQPRTKNVDAVAIPPPLTPQAAQEKYPVMWQGEIAMKSASTLVQMHRVCGNDQWMEVMNRELVHQANNLSSLKITQRMRLEKSHIENLYKKMEKDDGYFALICLPCGRNREDIHTQTMSMATSFISYFITKEVAGIVNCGPNGIANNCVAHVFPPSDFATEHLAQYAPEILHKVEKHNAGYLFVVITPA